MPGYRCDKCDEQYYDYSTGCSFCNEEKKEEVKMNYQEKMNKFTPNDKQKKEMIEMSIFLRDLAGRKLDEICTECYEYFNKKGYKEKQVSRSAPLLIARAISLIFTYHFQVTINPVLTKLEQAEEDSYVEN